MSRVSSQDPRATSAGWVRYTRGWTNNEASECRETLTMWSTISISRRIHKVVERLQSVDNMLSVTSYSLRGSVFIHQNWTEKSAIERVSGSWWKGRWDDFGTNLKYRYRSRSVQIVNFDALPGGRPRKRLIGSPVDCWPPIDDVRLDLFEAAKSLVIFKQNMAIVSFFLLQVKDLYPGSTVWFTHRKFRFLRITRLIEIVTIKWFRHCLPCYFIDRVARWR